MANLGDEKQRQFARLATKKLRLAQHHLRDHPLKQSEHVVLVLGLGTFAVARM